MRQKLPEKLDNKSYTVAWICALPIEQAVIHLDEYHDKLPTRFHDTTYIFGKIDVHNIVIACLPSMGTIQAARCATRLESGFPSLRFLLMVGIGGGVPTAHDVRLGDIVVSYPGKKHRGVVQYDFGTKFQDDALEILEARIQAPPDVLLTAITSLENSAREVGGIGGRLQRYVDDLVGQSAALSRCKRPENDSLFASDYRHLDDGLSCHECGCDASKTIERTARRHDARIPKVFKGLIASGNEVMRDAKERDRLAKELDVLCFEMEAAGLMTGVGCLVIRSICDYCDSHKNKEWQPYAAAVAAAYARELLKIIPGLAEDEAVAEAPKVKNSTSIVFSGSHNSGFQLGQNFGSIGNVS